MKFNAVPAPRHQPSFMRFASHFSASCASLIIAIGGAGCAERHVSEETVPSTAIVQRVKPAQAETIEWSGSVRTRQGAALAFSVPGRVRAIQAEIGDRVTAGMVLMELDAEPFQLQLRQAEAEVKAAVPALAEALRRKDSEQRLWQAEATSQSDYEAAMSAHAAAEARAETAAANLALANRAMRESRLIAPADGTLARRLVSAGAFVDAGIPVVEFDSSGPAEVLLAVPATKVADLTVSQSVEIRYQLTAVAPLVTQGTITHLSQRSLDGGVCEVLIQLTDAVNVLPGEPVLARLQTKARNSEVRVPATAVLRAVDGSSEVLIIAPGSHLVQRRPVTVGMPFGAEIILTAGLQPGELIVATGGAFLRDGQAIRPILRD
jgi:RND family efflux transporter MFP subunit